MGWFDSDKKEITTKGGVHMGKLGAAPKTARDPVCGMEVNVDKAPVNSAYRGQTYYFCTPLCKKAFVQNPTKYIKGAGHEEAGHSCHM